MEAENQSFAPSLGAALTGYFATWAGMLVSMTRIMTDSSFGMRPLDKHIDKIGVTLAVASSVG
jgi:phosphate/sulfate permease